MQTLNGATNFIVTLNGRLFVALAFLKKLKIDVEFIRFTCLSRGEGFKD